MTDVSVPGLFPLIVAGAVRGQSPAALRGASLEADAERDGDGRDDDEGKDGDGEAQHKSLIHRDVLLGRPGPDHHAVGPLIGQSPSVPHARVVDPHYMTGLMCFIFMISFKLWRMNRRTGLKAKNSAKIPWSAQSFE